MVYERYILFESRRANDRSNDVVHERQLADEVDKAMITPESRAKATWSYPRNVSYLPTRIYMLCSFHDGLHGAIQP